MQLAWPLNDPLVLDIETAPHEQAQDYLDPPEPDRRLTDPAKIAASVQEKTAQQLEKCSLDPNVGRIVALGIWDPAGGVQSRVAPTEADEIELLRWLWRKQLWSTLVVFNGVKFDLRWLVRRSQLLGVEYPRLSLARYVPHGVVDLYQELTFGEGHYEQGAMRRTLTAFARRFGVPISDDATTGAEMPALVAQGDWDAIKAHVEDDVRMTAQLAQKLGVIQPTEWA